jgi:TPR repeat protein
MLELEAIRGNSKACITLSHLYRHGDELSNIPMDKEKAKYWEQQALNSYGLYNLVKTFNTSKDPNKVILAFLARHGSTIMEDKELKND